MKMIVDDGYETTAVRYVGVAVRDSSGAFRSSVGKDGVIVTMDYKEAVMSGLIAGASSFTTNGRYVAAVAGTNQPVTSSGTCNVPASAGVQMSVVSSSANDAAAGTNIRAITIGYLDANLVQRTEVVTLNGATPVLTVATNIRFINTIVRASSGANDKAAGNIVISNGGTTYGQITLGDRIQHSSYRMIPAGKVFVPHVITASTTSTTAATASIFTLVTYSGGYFTPSTSMGVEDGSVVIPLAAGRHIPAGAIIGIEHTTGKAATVIAAIIGHLENA